MSKNIIFNEDARKAIKVGIDKLADAVKMTLGPRGRAVIIEKPYGPPMVTFDGVTVAKEIELEDRYENLGASLIKQGAEKTNDAVGDGTTTSVVLAQAMINEGEKLISEKGFNVIKLTEDLKNASIDIIAQLEEQRELINDEQKLKEVATISSKDEKTGTLIAEIMNKVGKEGVVTIEDSNTAESLYETVDGMQFDKGYIAPHMITDADRMEASLEKPYILVTDKQISSIQEIIPLIEQILKTGNKNIVIIADDVSGEALGTLIINKLKGIFNTLAIKAPGFGAQRKAILEDIAILTGARFISTELGDKLEEVKLEDLGEARRIISTKDTTKIVDGSGDTEEINARIKQIANEIEISKSDYDKEKLKERYGKLTGKVAVIKVGGFTESEQKEMKQRVEDAVNATRAAMEEGIVPGGGIALYTCAKAIDNNTENAALKILKIALEKPFKTILENSGAGDMEFGSTENNSWHGYNAVSGKLENLKEAGIIDPLKVVKTAFKNAISVASNYLMTGVAITNIPEEKKDNQQMM